jgi:hypothetical protein
MTEKIERAYKRLVSAQNRINARKCEIYGVPNTRECDYSLLPIALKSEADFLNLIEEDLENAIAWIKKGIYKRHANNLFLNAGRWSALEPEGIRQMLVT